MRKTLENCEQLSALADGQLHGAQAQHTLDWLEQNEDAQARWHSYHLVGDVMRLGAQACPERDAAFMQRMNAALDEEILKTLQNDAIEKEAALRQLYCSKGINGINKQAANDPWFDWRWAGGFATFLAVMVVAWQGLSTGLEPGVAPQLTQVTVPPPQAQAALPQALAQAPVMIRDPQLDAFLAAHKQLGGTSALQKPSGFLRNAVFEGESQ